MALDVYLTNACNLSCKYCFNLEKEDSPRIPLEKVCEILDGGYSKGHRYISVTGGEPFLYREIFQVLDHAHDLGFWINILSHGGLLDQGRIDRLKEYWRLRIRISLDGPDAKTHDNLRGEGTFVNTMKRIDMLIRNGVNVGVGVTVSENNVASMEEIIRIALDKGISYIRFAPVARVKKGKAAKVDAALHEKMMETIIASTVDHIERMDLPVDMGDAIDFPISNFTTKRCMAGKLFYGVTPDAKILPCPLLIDDPGFEQMKYESPETFDRMTAKMDAIFDSIKDKLGGICGTCEFRDTCYGGCLSEKLSFGLGIGDEQPVCTKLILERLKERFDPGIINHIVNSWVYRMKTSLEASETNTCMRHAPFWSMNFKRAGVWSNTEYRFA